MQLLFSKTFHIVLKNVGPNAQGFPRGVECMGWRPRGEHLATSSNLIFACRTISGGND